MALPEQRKYTIEDIYNLPEGTRAELIDGQLYYMAPPSTTHQRILNFINNAIYNYIKSKNGPCEVFPSPFAVYLNKDDEKYLEPDLSIICDKDKLDDKGCHGAPDWVVEIVSPSNPSHDYITKLSLYKAAGVREYWIVNPMKHSVYLYYLEENQFETASYTFQDKIKVNIYDDLTIDFCQLDI